MAEKQKTLLNEEQIVAFLQEIVEKIRTEEDPLELNVYRRLFKKAVPFHLRSYFAAYLLKQIHTGKNLRIQSGPSRNDRSSRPGRGERNDRGSRSERTERSDERIARSERGAEPRQRDGRQEESRRTRNAESRQNESGKNEPRPVLADDVSTTLFISIGRNRRVYPRDLIGLILQNVEMDREHIGDIRVLDNYSFVQVVTEDAEKIIAALNEFEYRGRKLAVSYSRKKEESAGTGISPETAEISDSEDDSWSETEDFASQETPEDSFESGEADADPADDKENNGNI